MRHLILITLAALLFTSCGKEQLRGNGEIVTETRNISGFDGVYSSGSNSIHITYGAIFKVEVRGSSNLVPRFKTRVRNNTLELGYDNVWNVHRDDIEVFVTMPLISNVSLSGSGNVGIKGGFPPTESFRLRISGSADVDIMDGFECRYLSTNISGSGKAKLRNLVSEDADVTISGSGDVWVTATRHLKVRISGSGDVYYDGDPLVDEEISGSGNVIRH